LLHVPPCASIAAIAVVENPLAEMLTFDFNSPLPRTLTSSLLDSRPLAFNTSGVISTIPLTVAKF
jgi:hypothetical protein